MKNIKDIIDAILHHIITQQINIYGRTDGNLPYEEKDIDEKYVGLVLIIPENYKLGNIKGRIEPLSDQEYMCNWYSVRILEGEFKNRTITITPREIADQLL